MRWPNFLAEQIVLAKIARVGLRLYPPKTFNYPDVDAAILQFDKKKNTAHLYPIQVTLATKHKDSETEHNGYHGQMASTV